MEITMHLMTFNANGIRSAVRKEFFDWFKTQDVDILCIQETKAQIHQLEDPVYFLPGYERYFLDADKPGYSGVAIYSRAPSTEVLTPLSGRWVDEGRFLGLRVKGLDVYSLYLPSGTSGEIRQSIKYEMMDELFQWMSSVNSPVVIAGDWNIAHQKIDLKNWRGNQKNSGFLPEERAWLDKLLCNGQWVDAFRDLIEAGDHYTWWTYRGQARAKNVGWRIDYHMVNQVLQNALLDVKIHPSPIFSDHAPQSLWLCEKKLESLCTS